MAPREHIARKAFIRLAGASVLSFAVGCHSSRGKAKRPFSLTILNPDCMAGGAGQCIVLRMPSGKTYLYDTGNGDFRGEKQKNNGRDIVVPYLKSQGIERVDGLIISHYHADHFGGFLWMWNHFPIARIYNNNYMPPTTGMSEIELAEYRLPRKLLDDWAALHPGCLIENTREGDELGWDEEDVRVEVVWPPKAGYVKALQNRAQYGKNDNPFHHLLNGNATALRLTVEDKVFFIAGDIQADYVRAYMRPKMEREGTWGCDFLVLPSHGTKPHDMVQDINAMRPRPQTVIASLGNLKWMRDVGRQVQDIYTKAGYKAYATCLCGDLTSTTDLARPHVDNTRVYPHNPL